MSARGQKVLPLQLVINDSSSFLGTGMTLKFELEEDEKKAFFYGKKIGDVIDGSLIGFAGYTFKITGGSDIAGFPHIKGIPGPGLKQIMRSGPPGYRPRKYKIEKKGGGYKIINLKNVRKKKTVRGEELSEWTRQVNLAILERSGADIKEMSENELANDKILKGIAEKLGKIILKWGFEGITFIGEGESTPLIEKFKELGLDDSAIGKIYFKVGVAVLKNFEKEELKKLLEPLKKLSRKKPPKLGRYIAAVIYTAYEELKEKENANPDELGEKLANEIVTAMRKSLEGNLEKPKKVPFKIKEGGE